MGDAPLPKEYLTFFKVHIDLDDSHAAELAAVIKPRISMSEEDSDIKAKLAIVEAMNARMQFFNGVQRQIYKYNFSSNFLLFANS